MLLERNRGTEVDELFHNLKEGNERIVSNAERAVRTVAQMDALNSAGSGESHGFVVAQGRIACSAAVAQIANLSEVNIDEALDAGAAEIAVMQQEMKPG